MPERVRSSRVVRLLLPARAGRRAVFAPPLPAPAFASGPLPRRSRLSPRSSQAVPRVAIAAALAAAAARPVAGAAVDTGCIAPRGLPGPAARRPVMTQGRRGRAYRKPRQEQAGNVSWPVLRKRGERVRLAADTSTLRLRRRRDEIDAVGRSP